jgi:hypothetical protein
MFRKGDWEACFQMKLPGKQDRLILDKPSTTQSLLSSLAGAEHPTLQPPLAHQFSIVGAAASNADSDSSKYPPIEAHPKTDSMLTSSAKSSCEAISEFISPGSAVQLLVQSAMLEKTIVATAESRRCLSEYRSLSDLTDARPSHEDILTTHPELLNVLYQKRMRRLPFGVSGYRNLGNQAPSFRAVERMSLPTSFSLDSTGLSNAHVQTVTSDVISAAVAALHGSEQQRQPLKSSLDAMAETSQKRKTSEPLSSLDAMTCEFLKRSNARRMQSRQSQAFRRGLRLRGGGTSPAESFTPSTPSRGEGPQEGGAESSPPEDRGGDGGVKEGQY